MSATLTWWSLIGFAGQGLFMLRFIHQWWVSERAGKSVQPIMFWYLSIAGAVLTLIYAVAVADLVFTVAGVLQLALHGRNLMLARRP